MDRRMFLAGSAVFAGHGLLAGCAPGAFPNAARSLVPLDAEEHARTIAGLKPPKRARPVIAVVVDEEGSETTDTIVPHAVLALSGVADVRLVATSTAPVELFPALTVVPQMSFDAFAQAYPEGADHVIVPASHRRESPTLLPWIRAQAAGGATVIGICAGARTVAAAGLLEGRQGTTHWYEIGALRKEAPGMNAVRDRRYVVDGGVVTTTGVTASVPVSLALVEAIAGADHVNALAARLGVSSWTAAHDTDAFSVTAEAVWAALSGRIAIWNHETVGLPVEEGVSAVALALSADAWARTDRSTARAVAAADIVTMDSGLQLAGLTRSLPEDARMVALPEGPPALALDRTLEAIAAAYGSDVARYVAVQVEYLGTLRAENVARIEPGEQR